MTNEGMGAEAGEEQDEKDEGSVVAYIGRASFRMEHTPVLGNDNRAGEVVQPVNHEDTLRIRIPPPSGDWKPTSAWELPEPELEEQQQPPPLEEPRAVSGVASVLVARLELPRWILATMTLVVFGSGVLVAASVIGGTRPRSTHPSPSSTAAALPALTLLPIAASAPIAAAAPAARRIANHHLTKPAAATTPPSRRPHKPAPPPPSTPAPRAEAITSRWVDPFAQ